MDCFKKIGGLQSSQQFISNLQPTEFLPYDQHLKMAQQQRTDASAHRKDISKLTPEQKIRMDQIIADLVEGAHDEQSMEGKAHAGNKMTRSTELPSKSSSVDQAQKGLPARDSPEKAQGNKDNQL